MLKENISLQLKHTFKKSFNDFAQSIFWTWSFYCQNQTRSNFKSFIVVKLKYENLYHLLCKPENWNLFTRMIINYELSFLFLQEKKTKLK